MLVWGLFISFSLLLDFSGAVPPNVYNIAQEFLATTQIDIISATDTNTILQSPHCAPNPSPPFVLYILYDSIQSHSCLQSLYDMWYKECEAIPTTIVLVHTLAYSHPLQSLSESKTHIVALTHSLTQEILSNQHPIPDNEKIEEGGRGGRGGRGGVMVLDMTKHCVQFSDTTSTSTSTIRALLSTVMYANTTTATSSGTVPPGSSSPPVPLYLLSSPQVTGTPSTTELAYLTTWNYIDQHLLENMITGSTLLEYATNWDAVAEEGVRSPYSLTEHWQQLQQTPENQFQRVNIFANAGEKVVLFNVYYPFSCESVS